MGISCLSSLHLQPALHHSRVLYPTCPAPSSSNHPLCPDGLRLHNCPALCRRLRCPTDLLRPFPSLLPLPSPSSRQLRAVSLPPAFGRTPGRSSPSSTGRPRGSPSPPVPSARCDRPVRCGCRTRSTETPHAGDDPDERRPLRPTRCHT